MFVLTNQSRVAIVNCTPSRTCKETHEILVTCSHIMYIMYIVETTLVYKE